MAAGSSIGEGEGTEELRPPWFALPPGPGGAYAPGMRVLVDGHNAMFALDIRAASHEEARAELLRCVRAVTKRAVVYFDAGNAPAHAPRVFAEQGVQVVYCGKTDADTAILEAVAGSLRPRSLRVVTNDRALARRCKEHRAAVVDVETFLSRGLLVRAAERLREEGVRTRRRPRPVDAEQRALAAESETGKPSEEHFLRPEDFGLPEVVDLDDPPAGL